MNVKKNKKLKINAYASAHYEIMAKFHQQELQHFSKPPHPVGIKIHSALMKKHSALAKKFRDPNNKAALTVKAKRTGMDHLEEDFWSNAVSGDFIKYDNSYDKSFILVAPKK